MGRGRSEHGAQLLRKVSGLVGKNVLPTFVDGTGGPFPSDPVIQRCRWGVAVLDFTDVCALSHGVWEEWSGLPLDTNTGMRWNCMEPPP